MNNEIIVYHSEIQIKPIAKTSDRYGFNAHCWFTTSLSKAPFECSYFGKTRELAESRMIDFLSSCGEDTLQQCEKDEKFNILREIKKARDYE